MEHRSQLIVVQQREGHGFSRAESAASFCHSERSRVIRIANDSEKPRNLLFSHHCAGYRIETVLEINA